MDRLQLTNLTWFLGWLLAVAVLFWCGLRLPLQTRLGRLGARLYTAGVIVAIFAVAVLANVALTLHDAHFDLTREKVFTPSKRALEVVDHLRRPVRLTYFYQGEDPHGRRAKDIVEMMGRRNRLLEVRTIDPDKQPTVAETFGVKVYNAAVLQADGRRIMVHSTDETEIAIGIQRVLRERVVNICFIEGHYEYPVDNFEFHTHFEGAAGHSHDQAGSAVIQTTAHGFGRMRRSLEALGYDVRKIIPASLGAIPPDCAVAVDAGPRTTYLPAESAALEAYLHQGGALLLMYDLGFVLEPGLERLLRHLGVHFQQAVVVDPKSHYATDQEMVTVTGYDPHPITRQVSLTFYPGIRALRLVQPARGIRVVRLISSSGDSYTRPVAPVAQRQLAPEPLAVQETPWEHHHMAPPERASGPGADATGSQDAPQAHVLAAAVEGTLSESGSRPFRAVLIGDSDFASNSFFPYMANSDLALAMVRWLVREEHATPIASRIPVPSLILLTKRQMQGIFLVIVVIVPFAVVALGSLVWWRRR